MFNEMFTEALMVGMTPDQFWNDDPALFFAYIEAYDKKQEIEINKINDTAWLQGLYIYFALCSTVPNFGSRGEYIKEPIKIGKTEEKEAEHELTDEELEEIEERKAINQFKAFGKFAEAFNKEHFGEEEGE